MKVLVLSGSNHQFESSATVINDFLLSRDDMSVTLTSDKNILASAELDQFDVCVFGTGFTRTVRQEDGTLTRQSELTSKQEDGFFRYIHNGKGLVGVHGTAWWIGGRAVDLIGGHSNWHPPGATLLLGLKIPNIRLLKVLVILKWRMRSIYLLMILTSIFLLLQNGITEAIQWRGQKITGKGVFSIQP